MKTPCRLLALLLSILLFNSAAIAASATEDPTLNEILRKHLEAMGGLNNWNRVESIQLNGTIEREGQSVHIVIVKKSPNQIRATVTVPTPGKKDEAFQIIRAHDGKNAWTATRLAGAPEMEKEALPAEAADELLADAGVLPPLIKLWHSGADLQLLSPENIGGKNHYRIQASSERTSAHCTFYLSADSFLVTQYKSVHPTSGTTLTRLENYTEKQGVLIPRVNLIQSQQTGDSVMTTSSIKIGVGIYEGYFGPDDATSTARL